jgi:hypothetical protein
LSRNLKVKIYKSIILPVVLYGCETWSLTLREVHRLSVFENSVLRRIFGPTRDEVTAEWRKLNNGELHNFYSSPNIVRQIKSRKMRWAGHVARMGGTCTGFFGKTQRKKQLESPRRRGKEGIKMDLGEIGLGGCGVDSPGSGYGALAGSCECGDEPSGSGATELVS